MPGYDTNRFVDLTQNEKSELICSICQDILCCAVVTNCCLQSFCDDCINDWINTNNTCPYDRKTLTTDQLSRAPRAMMNMLGKLRIRCDFCENGCDEVIGLEDLSNHLLQCRYKQCVKCFYSGKAKHDCVEYLLETNNKISIELNELKISHEESLEVNRKVTNDLHQLNCSYKDVVNQVITSSQESNYCVNLLQQINELKKEKENFLETFAELSNDEQSSNACNSLMPNNISSFTAKVRKVEMSGEMRNVAMNILYQALEKYNVKRDVATYIKEKFDKKYGKTWNCIVGTNFDHNVTYVKHYILIDQSNYSILLFKS